MPYDLKTLLRGESKNVEYKLTPPSRSINYTKPAVAFANEQGGRLGFGVEDGDDFAWLVLPKTKCSR